MAQFFPREKIFSENVRDEFKYEIAEELGLTPKIQDGYWGALSAADCGRVGGKIGGNMVKAMVRRAEALLAQDQANKLT
ncbi:alpha/beta-type small acid-soluble spore protein [Heliobacterium chlorum]|uniref:Alpha/beta-type small acid-soluble spore protein n=1 Tax=Heliobacterium chlorum TaxID=2698 RepID=A0ABR7T5A7_HELCL|nr:alpha/beta-type small acid-soluble spore protein [Heliobacterium chlorum]MBC9785972.1 alpha/beta-type small acid-soluble spore protein [Heliobacterium chlorum]